MVISYNYHKPKLSIVIVVINQLSYRTGAPFVDLFHGPPVAFRFENYPWNRFQAAMRLLLAMSENAAARTEELLCSRMFHVRNIYQYLP